MCLVIYHVSCYLSCVLYQDPAVCPGGWSGGGLPVPAGGGGGAEAAHGLHRLHARHHQQHLQPPRQPRHQVGPDIDINTDIYHESPSFSKHVTDLGVVEAVCGEQSLLPARLQQILLDGTSVTSRSDTSHNTDIQITAENLGQSRSTSG